MSRIRILATGEVFIELYRKFNRNFPFEKKFFFPKFSKHRSIEFLFPFIYRRRSFEIIAESALFFFSLPGRSVKMAARFFSFFLSFFFSLATQ